MPRLEERSGPRSASTDTRAGVLAGRLDEHEGTAHEVCEPAMVAELAVLGAMIISTTARAGAVEMLTRTDFVGDARSAIFETIARMTSEGVPVDLATLTVRLADDGRLDEVGGAYDLALLISMECCPAPSHWHAYAAIVKREATRRHTIRVLRRAVDRLEEGDDPDEVRRHLEVDLGAPSGVGIDQAVAA